MNRNLSERASPADVQQRSLTQELAIEKLRAHNGEQQRQLENQNKKLKEALAREKAALILLKNLVEGLQSTDIEIPGYEDAMAFFIQEKMLGRGGDIEISLPVSGDITVDFETGNAAKILKL